MNAEMGSQVPRTVWVIGLNVLAMAGVVLIIHQTRQVLAWMAVALFIALAVDPAVAWLVRKGFRRGLAVLSVFALGAAFITLLVATIVPVLLEQGRNLVRAAPDMLETLREHSAFQWADAKFDLIDGAKRELTENAGDAAGPLFKIVGGAFAGILATITVVFLTVFLLLFGGRLFETGLEWIEPSRRPRYLTLSRRIHRSVAGYVSGSLLIALIGGVVTAVATAILGVPYFLPLGLAMMLLGLVPFIGGVVGGALVVGTTFLASGTKAGVIALVIFIAYQQLESHLLQPLVQRKTIKMSPLLIVMVMIVGTSLAGVLGALLSLPIAGAIQVVLQDVLERRKAKWAGNGATASSDDAG